MAKVSAADYDKMMSAYDAKMKADAATAKKAKEAEYASQAKSAYVSKVQNERNLQNNLTQAGIRGGATESAQLKLATNYGNNMSSLNTQKSSALTEIDKNANDAMFSNRQTQTAAKMAYLQAEKDKADQIKETKRQEKWQEKQTSKQNSETRFAATVSGYTDNKAIDKLIKKIKKSGKNTWRIAYLRAQKKVNKDNAKKK